MTLLIESVRKNFTNCPLFLFAFLSFGWNQSAFATDNWQSQFEYPQAFIENHGQFDLSADCNGDQQVLYAYHRGGLKIFFTKSGVSFSFNESKPYKLHKREQPGYVKKDRLTKFSAFESADDYFAEEFEGRSPHVTFDHLSYYWPNANPSVQIEAKDPISSYFSYGIRKNGKTTNENEIPGFRELIYRDLYPGIDLIFTFHPSGDIKYSLDLEPGADLSQFSMQFQRAISIDAQGNLRIPTAFGDIIDHAPTAELELSGIPVPTKFKIDGQQVSFETAAYDPNQGLLIDPWVQTPNFNTQWDCVWECETDGAGNAYLIGGVWPMQLHKYDPAGNLQWVYNTPYDSSSWLGTFATDNAGNSYVTLGSTAAIQRINTNGGLVWDNPNPGGLFLSTEFWNITFNCDQTQLVVGGTGGFLPPLPYIYNIDMTSGNVLNSVQVTGGALLPTQEVRAITATQNAKYYYLTHDSIGFIHESLTSCVPPNNLPFHVNNDYNLGYKCEDWRRNNTGIAAIAYYNGFIFTHRGDRIDKRDFNTAAIINSAPIPSGAFTPVFGGGNTVSNSGIAIDDCGNVFVGSRNMLVQFDENLLPLGTFPTLFNVYDVAIGTAGEVICAGSTGNSGSGARVGTIQSFTALACNPQQHVCCDATICPEDALCSTDPAITLTTVQSGGTFSGPGIIDQTNGVFDPSVAGPGRHGIVYTLACGSDSLFITVNLCGMIMVCEEPNGDYTASGGDGGPFNWFEPIQTQDCSGCFPFPFPPCQIPPGCAVNVLDWNQIATGTTVSLPAGADTIRITDNNQNEVIVLLDTLAACSNVCVVTVDPEGPFCAAAQSVTLTASESGGSWSGSGIVNASSGLFDPAQANIGSNEIVYSIPCGATDTIFIQINASDTASFSYSAIAYCLDDNDPAAIISGTSGGTFSIDQTGVINATNGTIDLDASGTGTFNITYTTSGNCADSSTVQVTINDNFDASIATAGPFCANEGEQNLTAQNPGGVWAGTGITDQINGTFDPAIAGAGQHLISYAQAGSCGDTSTITITVNAADTAAIGYAATYCIQDANPAAQISGTIGGLFSIDNGGSINQNSGEVDLTTSGIGDFNVIYQTTGPCPDSDTAAITITGLFNATISPAGPFCTNQSAAQLQAVDSGGTWNSTGITDQNAGIFDPSVAGVGTFEITYTFSGNCASADTITVDVGELPILTASADTAICLGGTATLSASSTEAVQWTGGSTDSVLVVSPVSTTTYTVQSTNSCGIVDDAVQVTVDPGPSLNPPTNSDSICSGESYQLSVSGASTYSWSPGATLSDSTIANPVAQPVSTTSYTVIGISQSGCQSDASITVHVVPSPSVELGQDSTICCEESVTLSIGTTNDAVLWSDNSTTATLSVTEEGLYWVQVTNTLGCADRDSVLIEVRCINADASAVPDIIFSGETAELEVVTDYAGNFSYNWQPTNGLSDSAAQSTETAAIEETLYTVVVTDLDYGCEDADTVRLVVIPLTELVMPEAFSPNGDLLNDEFYPLFGGLTELKQFRVYNRWGDLMHDALSPWNGKLKGKDQPTGTYTYFIEALVPDVDNPGEVKTMQRQGAVMLLH